MINDLSPKFLVGRLHVSVPDNLELYEPDRSLHFEMAFGRPENVQVRSLCFIYFLK